MSAPTNPLDQLEQMGGGTSPASVTPASSQPGDILDQLASVGTSSNQGEIVNDVGNRVIVPKEGESFADTMRRAAEMGKTVTPQQINAELATAPKKAAQVGAAAVAIPAVHLAASALYDLAVSHLAGNVLPGMEEEAAKAKLLEYAPKVAQAAKDLGIGAGGIGLLWKAVFGNKK